MKPLYRRSIPKPPPARESHDSIRQQTETYLKSGGRITVIPTGYSGIPRMQGPQQKMGKKLYI